MGDCYSLRVPTDQSDKSLSPSKYTLNEVKWMKVKELIEQLKQFNEDQEVVLFDKESNPKKIDHVVIDTTNDGCFNCIVLDDVEE